MDGAGMGPSRDSPRGANFPFPTVFSRSRGPGGPRVPPSPAGETNPTLVVGRAIQDLAAARLGRAFLPLALLLASGVVGMVMGRGVQGFALAVGAPLSAGTMLAFGQRTVRRAFGGPPRPWMAWAAVGGLVPPAYGIWVMAWLGFRGLTVAQRPRETLLAILFAALGLWLLRSWLRIVELQQLAAVMTRDSEGGEEGQR